MLTSTLHTQAIMVVGQAGSGKSWWCGRYGRIWKEQHPEGTVYVFSAKDEDRELDNVGVKRIMIDDELVNTPLDMEDFANSLVIFDDIDNIVDKKQRKAVMGLCDQMLGVGRAKRIWVIKTSHFFFNWQATRGALMEANKVVYFPGHGSGRQGEDWLKKNAKLDKKQIATVNKLKSRWIVYDMTVPHYVLSEFDLIII